MKYGNLIVSCSFAIFVRVVQYQSLFLWLDGVNLSSGEASTLRHAERLVRWIVFEKVISILERSRASTWGFRCLWLIRLATFWLFLSYWKTGFCRKNTPGCLCEQPRGETMMYWARSCCWRLQLLLTEHIYCGLWRQLDIHGHDVRNGKAATRLFTW